MQYDRPEVIKLQDMLNTLREENADLRARLAASNAALKECREERDAQHKQMLLEHGKVRDLSEAVAKSCPLSGVCQAQDSYNKIKAAKDRGRGK